MDRGTSSEFRDVSEFADLDENGECKELPKTAGGFDVIGEYNGWIVVDNLVERDEVEPLEFQLSNDSSQEQIRKWLELNNWFPEYMENILSEVSKD